MYSTEYLKFWRCHGRITKQQQNKKNVDYHKRTNHFVILKSIFEMSYDSSFFRINNVVGFMSISNIVHRSHEYIFYTCRACYLIVYTHIYVTLKKYLSIYILFLIFIFFKLLSSKHIKGSKERYLLGHPSIQ